MGIHQTCLRHFLATLCTLHSAQEGPRILTAECASVPALAAALSESATQLRHNPGALPLLKSVPQSSELNL